REPAQCQQATSRRLRSQSTAQSIAPCPSSSCSRALLSGLRIRRPLCAGLRRYNWRRYCARPTAPPGGLPGGAPVYGDLLATTCLIVSAGLHLTGHNDSQPSLLCAYATGATTALFVCSFGLTLAYAYQVYLRQRTASRMAFEGDTGGGMSDSDGSGGSGGGCDSDKGHWKALAAIGVAWAAPLLAEAGLLAAATAHWSSAGHAHTGGGSGDGIICSSCLPIFRFDQDPCWPADSESASPRMWLKLAFLIPLLCVLLGCCGLYWLAVRHRDLRDRRLGSLTAAQADARPGARPFVLGSLSLVLSEETADKFFWLYILQAATAPLQGLLN
uniref:Frizzled-4 n=1 Tax=Macrostomum lignano TaxID=282301 RepID=A0A1I8F9T2_9PLAT